MLSERPYMESESPGKNRLSPKAKTILKTIFWTTVVLLWIFAIFLRTLTRYLTN